MRKILYASGIEGVEGEDELAQNEEKDERFLDRIVSDFNWAQINYSERNEEFERNEKWFYRDHYEKPLVTNSDMNNNYPKDSASNYEDEHLVTLNIPFSSVQRAHTMITGEAPIIEVLKSTDKGERVSKLLHGVMQINTRRWGSNPMHDAMFDQLLYGWGVVSTTWNRRDYKADDFKGDRPLYEFPVTVRSIPPREIYPIPGGSIERWKAVIHAQQMRVYEVEDEWDVVLHMCDEDAYGSDDPDNFDYTEPLNPEKMVDVIDYWCWEGAQIYHAVVAHNQFVMRPAAMKFYDALPFTIFFCGATTSNNPANYGLSINYALIDSVSEMEYLTNRMMRIADLYADPTLVVTRINDDPVITDPTSKVIDLVEGESARYLSHQGSIPELDKLLAFFRGLVDDEGFGNIAGASGIDTIAQQQSAMIKIFKPVENAQSAWEDVNRKIVGLIQRYSWEEPIEVAGRMEGDEADEAFSFSMKGSDTKGCRETKVRLRARFPLEELRNVAAAATARNAELMPTDIIQKKFLGAQDTQAWERKILEQKIKNSPEALSMIIQQRLMLINQQSSIQSLIDAELAKGQQENEVLEREALGTQGGPANPPEVEPQQAVAPESLVQQGMNDAAMGLQDNPTPMSQPGL